MPPGSRCGGPSQHRVGASQSWRPVATACRNESLGPRYLKREKRALPLGRLRQ
jgi:hypothetical protein